MFSLWSYLVLAVPVLVNVAFLTLLERKIMGVSQSRKGPNKVSLGGLLQPIADAVKLFLKEFPSPSHSNLSIYKASPAGALFLMLMLWVVTPWGSVDLDYAFMGLLLLMSLGLFPLLLAGWASNSAYATIGAIRGVAQTISYEVALALILMGFFSLVGSTSFKDWEEVTILPSLALMGPMLLMWLIAAIAETNRTPFDFSEGESELVSGFNIEYASGGFALIFMAEYGMILFFSMMTTLLLGGAPSTRWLSIILILGVSGVWLWTRCTLPRARYDKLMSFCWKALLPSALAALMFYCVV